MESTQLPELPSYIALNPHRPRPSSLRVQTKKIGFRFITELPFHFISFQPPSLFIFATGYILSRDKLAQDHCKTFLESYVEYSERPFLVLGPHESEKRRTVNTAAAVQDVWRDLIAEAHGTMLRDKRQQDPENSTLWEVQFAGNSSKRGSGPVFEISQVRSPVPKLLSLLIKNVSRSTLPRPVSCIFFAAADSGLLNCAKIVTQTRLRLRL